MDAVDAYQRKRSALFIVMAGIWAGISIPGSPAGLNLSIVTALLLAGLWAIRAKTSRSGIAMAVAGAVVATFFTIRAAPWLTGLNLLATSGLLTLASVRASTWHRILTAPLLTLVRLPRGFVYVASSLPGFDRTANRARVPEIIRAASLSGVLLVVFGGLFLSADPAFATLAEQFVVPDLDVGLLPARAMVALACCSLGGAWMLLRGNTEEIAPSPWGIFAAGPARWRPRPAEWATALAVLNVLFLSFVVVQITVLFGGHARVLQTAGLTYAQYARSGFFQLLLVAALTLGLIALVIRYGAVDPGWLRWTKALLGILCVLTLIVLVSAWTRMNLYQEAYGFTRLRVMVEASIWWLAAVFVAVIAAGAAWSNRWLPRAVVGISAATVIGLNLYNPDARIAQNNVDRFERTGRIDAGYLSGLSADAIPALQNLDEPHRSCVLGSVTSRIDGGSTWWSFNFSRDWAVTDPPQPGLPGDLTC